ncbi:MAG: glycosyltransferase [Candidatus Eisenbacteria bacterium]|uniref:Glycosyltransferase n=1 Tax=Eiseniibacteriota bacterium TaxID=2212470 RepID=A0A937XCM4_UNCEI|nr:glycosyltransferase [Candidatus Eisenbacteria bacterium]
MAHLAALAAPRRGVLYVEPSFSLLRRAPAHCPPGQANPWLAPRLAQRAPRLWTLAPPRGLPLWTHPAVSRLQHACYGAMLRRAARRLGYGRVWLWLYNPLYVQAMDSLRPERLILDLVDDLGAYEARAHSRRTTGACLERALAQADLVLTTSALLAEAHAAKTRAGRLEVVPNGVRGEWIGRPAAEPPAELRGLPRPWIGFVGAVSDYLDFELLVAAARRFAAGSLILVGPVRGGEGEKGAARLRRERNAHLLGHRPQERVPDYAAAFDVCLCPFRVGAVRRAVNPLKVYEYLAAGRPVVATPLESLASEPVAAWIRFAEVEEAFLAAIAKELALERAGGAPAAAERSAARRRAVRPYAWESISTRVASILDRAEEAWAAGAGDRGPAAGAGDRSPAAANGTPAGGVTGKASR